MASSEGKVTLSAAVPIELKERIQHIASERRWTLSQALVVFLTDYIDTWEVELGISTPEPTQSKKSKK